MQEIKDILYTSAELKRKVADTLAGEIEQAIGLIRTSLNNGGRLFLMGNGGSAGDAQHIAAELIGRYKRERKSVPAMALTTDTSILTSLGNDYGYDTVFARQIEGWVKEGDVVIGISTSGNSENVVRGVNQANKQGAVTIGFLGNEGGKLKAIVNLPIVVPSNDTGRIQESHIAIGHTICEILEKDF